MMAPRARPHDMTETVNVRLGPDPESERDWQVLYIHHNGGFHWSAALRKHGNERMSNLLSTLLQAYLSTATVNQEENKRNLRKWLLDPKSKLNS